MSFQCRNFCTRHAMKPRSEIAGNVEILPLCEVDPRVPEIVGTLGCSEVLVQEWRMRFCKGERRGLKP